MWRGKDLYKCPLCDRAARAVELVELPVRWIDCSKCTSYQISKGLERMLAEDPQAKERAGYLSAAALRAKSKGERLTLTEDNYLGIASQEADFQQSE